MRDGCLTDLGVPSLNHAVGLSGKKMSADGGLKRGEPATNLRGKDLPEPGAGGWCAVERSQRVGKHRGHVKFTRWLIESPQSFDEIGV